MFVLLFKKHTNIYILNINGYKHTFMYLYIQTFMLTFIHTYMHTYICTDIHQYIHTYIQRTAAVCDRNVLFNDALNTFYLWLYGVGTAVYLICINITVSVILTMKYQTIAIDVFNN